MAASLTVIIITKNEETNIEACLQSVLWADEIIVVDSGSTDSTMEISKRFTDHVFYEPWEGFGKQKNRALDRATGDWVLSIDADERVTAELRREIELVLSGDDNKYVAYRIPRLSSYCGRFMRHGGWWPDLVVRLVQRGWGRFSEDLIHEKLIVKGPIGQLRSHLLHYTFRDLEQVIDTINRYSTAGAEMKYRQGKKGGLGKALIHGVAAFIKTYFVKCGFLDGREGLMLAISNAEGAYYRYLKLMYLCRWQADD